MRYDDLFITDKSEIEKIIQEAKLEIDSTIIVTVNKIITKEFTLPISSNEDNITDIIDQNCCIYFLSCFYHNKPTVHVTRTQPQKKNTTIEDHHKVMFNLILFLQSLCTEDLIMIAKYHNLYFKNFTFTKVLQKEKLVLEQHLTLINWVYDHICIYLYHQNYKF